jgi:hypothetical protein
MSDGITICLFGGLWLEDPVDIATLPRRPLKAPTIEKGLSAPFGESPEVQPGHSRPLVDWAFHERTKGSAITSKSLVVYSEGRHNTSFHTSAVLAN